MTNIQKIIKYLSLAFAFYLIISIIFGILSIFNLIDKINIKKEEKVKYFKTVSLDNTLDDIDINLKFTSLYIKNGDEFIVETTNKNININQNNDKIKIFEKTNISLNDNNKVTITIPKEKKFNNISIDSGAGTLNIESLIGENIDLDFGAGKASVNNLISNNKTDIDTGAGSVKFNNCKLNNLDLDMGIGKLELNGYLFGKNEVDTGIGKLYINLLNSKNEYTFKVDKGIGEILLNKEKLTDSKIYGDGINLINISGGIGTIDIKTS